MAPQQVALQVAQRSRTPLRSGVVKSGLETGRVRSEKAQGHPARYIGGASASIALRPVLVRVVHGEGSYPGTVLPLQLRGLGSDKAIRSVGDDIRRLDAPNLPVTSGHVHSGRRMNGIQMDALQSGMMTRGRRNLKHGNHGGTGVNATG